MQIQNINYNINWCEKDFALAHAFDQLGGRKFLNTCPEFFYDKELCIPQTPLHEITHLEWIEAAQAWTQKFQIKKQNLFQGTILAKFEGLALESLARTCFEHIQACHENCANYLLACHPNFPKQLYNIPSPPFALTVVGSTLRLIEPMIAIVGSRVTHPEILDVSQNVAKMLARQGYVIVSGGAYGCDISAHLGALESFVSPLPTVVVFAGGLQSLYPKGNEDVFKRIVSQQGALISERLWWAASRSQDFLHRNRIISGLSQCVIIMDSDIRSGAIVTAKAGLDQGKEILVYGRAEYINRGNEQLISEGAKYFTTLSDFERMNLCLV